MMRYAGRRAVHRVDVEEEAAAEERAGHDGLFKAAVAGQVRLATGSSPRTRSRASTLDQAGGWGMAFSPPRSIAMTARRTGKLGWSSVLVRRELDGQPAASAWFAARLVGTG